MTDSAVIGRLLDEYHERSVQPAAIEVVSGSVQELRISYKLTLADGSAQLIRAFRADEPVPVHGRGLDNETLADWLLGRARTLAALAVAGYRAPRPVLTRTGELVAVAGPWLAWATTFARGTVIVPTLSQLQALGETLGLLHLVDAGAASADAAGTDAGAGAGAGAAGAGRPGFGSRHPAVAVPSTLSRLDAIADVVPVPWQAMYAEIRRAALAVEQAAGAVSECIVHGDVWARNAVQAGADEPVTLIDWENGGLGLAVLDLGNCLMECHLDAGVPDIEPEAWLISPDEDRIAAVARGYSSVRALSAAEIDLLPESVRFSAAVVGAVHLELALAEGVTGPTMDARLARIENRLGVADEVAALARSHLADRQ
jgi:Ser/Thr protein kinase RdoA (MazF antagonist)